MIDIPKKTTERAILVALHTKDLTKELVEEHLTELEELAITAGATTILKVTQDKYSADPAFYIGKGKAEELATLAEENEIDLVISDDDLSPVQLRNLENLIKRKIVDRSGLILDIFASRAKSKEAKTQVELAQLQYMLPRLTRAWTHLSKQFGGIGTKGPGETQIETDRRIIRTRISLLKDKLLKIESTLFNILTKAGVFAEDKLFATLDSTTRSVDFGKNDKLLISDTVGFIRKLPAHLVASFKSTLNEVRDADIILHVIDISHAYFEDHIKVVAETMKELKCSDKIQLMVFNKVDAVEDKDRIEYVKNKYKDGVIISAERGINIIALKAKVNGMIQSSFVVDNIRLDISDSKMAAKIHSLAEVISTKYNNKSVQITYKANKENSAKIKKMVNGE
jgi:GTP-binding protein HflX